MRARELALAALATNQRKNPAHRELAAIDAWHAGAKRRVHVEVVVRVRGEDRLMHLREHGAGVGG